LRGIGYVLSVEINICVIRAIRGKNRVAQQRLKTINPASATQQGFRMKFLKNYFRKRQWLKLMRVTK
jgi:hypothetical protein